MKKSKIITGALLVLIMGIILASCPEPKTEYVYVTEACDDPNHGSTCDGNHEDLHDLCGSDCEHDVYDCGNATLCYNNLTLALKQAREERATKCAAVGCKTGNSLGICDDKMSATFRNEAFDIWCNNGRGSHNVDYNRFPNGSNNSVFVESGATNHAIAPCLTPAEIAQAKKVALDSMEHTFN